MLRYIFVSLIALFSIGCSTLEIQTDYNTQYDFSKISTFNVKFNKQNDGKDFSRSQIKRALIDKFQNMGYVLSEEKQADIYIVLHLDIETIKQIETNYETLNIYPRRIYYGQLNQIQPNLLYVYSDPFMNDTTRVTTQTYQYEQSNLVIELIDTKTNDVFWQGNAKDELSNLSTQKEKSEYINMVINKLFVDYPRVK